MIIIELDTKIDSKTAVLLLAVAFALLISFTGFTGKSVSKTNSFYIDRDRHLTTFSDSQCNKVGGMPFTANSPGKMIDNKMVKLMMVSESSLALVNVDGASRTIHLGDKIYINGLDVTLFAAGTNDACLIVK